jgi:hypothetical protein
LIGLNLLLWLHISAHGRVDIEDAAEGMLHQAEARLDEAMTQLVAFSIGTEHASCAPDVLEALGHAILKAPHVKEIAIMDQMGTPVCSPSSAPRVVRVVSPKHDTAHPKVKFSVVDFGQDSGPKSVQLFWSFPDDWGAFDRRNLRYKRAFTTEHVH